MQLYKHGQTHKVVNAGLLISLPERLNCAASAP